MISESVLIIGSGFLGRAMALRLEKKGCRVTVLSPHVSRQDWPEKIAVVNGRQEDSELLSDLLGRHETVIHAAWGTTPGSSAGQPALEARIALVPFLGFLETLQQHPACRLLFLSSGGTVYGDAGSAAVAEGALLTPRSCHGASKVAAEKFIAASGHPALILRPSNIYGPGQPLRPGFGVIPHLLDCIAEDEAFTLFGDGRQVRDYLYIDDFVDAVEALLARRELSGPFNIGSGTGTSLRELIGAVEAACGKALLIKSQLPRDGDVMHSVLEIGRIKQATGWAPRVGLREGIDRTYRAGVL